MSLGENEQRRCRVLASLTLIKTVRGVQNVTFRNTCLVCIEYRLFGIDAKLFFTARDSEGTNRILKETTKNGLEIAYQITKEIAVDFCEVDDEKRLYFFPLNPTLKLTFYKCLFYKNFYLVFH